MGCGGKTKLIKQAEIGRGAVRGALSVWSGQSAFGRLSPAALCLPGMQQGAVSCLWAAICHARGGSGHLGRADMAMESKE